MKMKRSELFLNVGLVPMDFIMLMLAAAGAYWLRVSPLVQDIRPAMFVVELPFHQYMQLAAVVSVLTVGVFALQGLYAMRGRRRIAEEFTKIFAGVSIGVMGVIIWMFLVADLFESRFILLAAFGLAVILVTAARYVTRRVHFMALRRGYGVYRTLLVGNGMYGTKLQEILTRRPDLGYKLMGRTDVARWDKLEEFYRRGLDEIIMTDPTLTDEDHLTLLDFCERYKIGYKYVPNLLETHATSFEFRNLGGVPLVELVRTPLEGWGRVAKRGMDVFGSSLGLLLLAPLFLAVAFLIKMDSKGPVFYYQTRIGRNKRPFLMYKFRSMKVKYSLGEKFGGKRAEEFASKLRQENNERKEGPLFKLRNDPRVTKVGRVLRRTRIDELPQLWNVLRGEMSLIGPRPHLPDEVSRYDRHHEKLFTIKPGMSGMAQVNGSSGLPFQEEAKMDIGYIENWSLRLDVILLLKTFWILLTDRNAV